MVSAAPPSSAPEPESQEADRQRGGGVLRGGAMNLVGSAVNGALTFLVVIVLARRTSSAEVGAFMVGVGGLTIASQTAQLGANIGLVRFVSRLRVLGGSRAIRPLFRVALMPVLVASGIAGCSLYVAAPAVASLLGASEDADRAVRYLQLMAPFVPAMAVFLVLAQGTQGFGTMVPSVLIDRIGRSVMQFAGILLLAASGALSTAASWVFPYIIGVIGLALWTRNLIEQIEGPVPVPEQDPPTGEFWRFCLPRGLASTFQISMLWLDTILIAFLRSPTEAGIYSVASRFLVVGSLVIGALIHATSPRLAEFFALEDIGRANALYQRTAGWVVALVWPAYLGIFAFAPFFLRIFGEEYVAGTTALRIIALSMMLSAACGAVDMVLLMGGKSWLSVVNWGSGFIVYVGLNVLLIPRMGIEGAAIAWAASIVVRNLIPLYQVWSMMGLSPFSRPYAVAATSALVIVGGTSALALWLFDHSIEGVAVTALVGGGLYLLALSRVGRALLRGSSLLGDDADPGPERTGSSTSRSRNTSEKAIQ